MWSRVFGWLDGFLRKCCICMAAEVKKLTNEQATLLSAVGITPKRKAEDVFDDLRYGNADQQRHQACASVDDPL